MQQLTGLPNSIIVTGDWWTVAKQLSTSYLLLFRTRSGVDGLYSVLSECVSPMGRNAVSIPYLEKLGIVLNDTLGTSRHGQGDTSPGKNKK